jgi:uroporphyrinogen-III decarboxylase
MLTSRERLLRFFSGQPIDRIPIWLLAPFHPLGCYADIYNLPCYEPIVRRIERGDCDTFDRRGCYGHFLYTADPDLNLVREMNSRNGIPHEETHITWRGRILRSRTHRLSKAQQYRTWFIDDPAQLDLLLQIPYVPVRPDLGRYRRERAELADRGLYMLDLGDPLGVLYNLMSATDFSMATATDYDILLQFLDTIYPRVIDLYRTFLDNDIADCYFIVGAEFAGPPLAAPTHFMELSARYVRGICDLIRSYGKISIVHYHGQLLEVLAGFHDMRPDGLHTVELPPTGNCSLQQARAVLGPEMALIGPVQYDDLVRLPAEEIEAQVIDAIRAGSSGRFILSPTAGPYETQIDDRTVQNYLTLIDTGLKYGQL